MSDQKGLKISVTYKKDIGGDNQARIRTEVMIQRAKGVCTASRLMKAATDDVSSYNWINKTFDTAAEAEQWAKVITEKIRVEYAATVARIDAVEVPEDFEVYG